ncbi:MAG: hypothetical protein GTN71_05755 [Anaerolineae bacterium]|nr:hypothetical protein [Anaerolineae bacterium]
MKRIMILTLFVFLAGCTERVPPGYVGMKMTASGLEGKVLQPGNHSCFWRDRLVLISTREKVYTESLSILCKDDLNFKFDLKIRARLKSSDANSVKTLLRQQGQAIRWKKKIGVLSSSVLYKTYVKPAARSIARDVVAKYETTQIRENRAAIQSAIWGKLKEAVKKSPVELTLVAASNFDYPDVITKAVEKKREREIAIGQEKAKQAMKMLQAKNKQSVALLKMQNRLKIAQMKRKVRMAEAQAENAYEEIRAKGIKDKYLKLRQIENQALLYSKAGKVQILQITGGKGGAAPTIVPVLTR